MRKTLAARLLASFVVALVIASGLTGMVERSRAASAPNILSYQGRVLNTNGVPVSSATASMKFEVYDDPNDGSGICLWSNSSATCDSNTPASTAARTVTLTDGLFSENLGDTTGASPYAAIADTVFGSNGATYLQIYINGEKLLPRKQIVAAPYANNSDTLDGLDATSVGGVVAAVLALDSSGNLQLTGNPSGSGIGAGSLYVNPATAQISANDTLFGVANNGSDRFRVDAEGDTALQGDLVVGGTTLASPFSVDESGNEVRIGDGVSDANDPKIVMYASDGADSGTFGYADEDRFVFTGGDIFHTGLGTLPTTANSSTKSFATESTFSGTSLANLNNLELFSLSSIANYSAVENVTSTDHAVGGAQAALSITGGTTTLSSAYGLVGAVRNFAPNNALLQPGGRIAGVFGTFSQVAAATAIPAASGVHGRISADSGTITSAYAVVGEVAAGVGTITDAYGGSFSATAAGASRYGIMATASGGGGTNISGYFYGSRVQIDDDATANTPDFATGAGDLYVFDGFETDGGAVFGDASGSDLFTFTSNATSQSAVSIIGNSLTSGTGLTVSRLDDGGATAFDGKLVAVSQGDSSAGSGSAIEILQNGAGTSVGLYITQATVSPHVANTTGNNALVIDVNEAANADNVIVVRSDADNSSASRDTEFRVNNQGDVFGDGATYNAGADYAEFFRTNDTTLTSMRLACQDLGLSEGVRACLPGERGVMGVVSSNPGFVGNNIPGANGDLRNDPGYRLVGMVGQIETVVNANEGAINVGDPIAVSRVTAGYGAKAHGPVRILGFALEPLASGNGTIRVLVQPQWYGGDVLTGDGSTTELSSKLAISAFGIATSDVPGVDSETLTMRGSAWNGSAAEQRGMSIGTNVQAMDDYRLSVRNADGVEVAYVEENGDFGVSGKLFPSDRGVMQRSKYIYYDGSSGAGGDFMRTNAAGWGTGSYDFAEMFASSDVLSAGEVVIFGDAKEQVKRSVGAAYDQLVAGVVSTRPGFLAGDNAPGQYPIALAGRVPTKVSSENGVIAIGDPLTTSSRPGYAMKATEPGPILGYATEAFSGDVGQVIAFINISYYDGGPVEEAPATENVVSGFAREITRFDVSGALNLNGGSILSIGSLQGIGNSWRIEDDGDFVTYGRLVQLVRSYANEDIETYAATSREVTVQLSGTVTLDGGAAFVDFEQIDPKFNDIIAAGAAYRVFLTPYGATGTLFPTNRSTAGFMITEAGTASNGVAVDWLVIAYHKDFAPEVVEEVQPIVEAPQVIVDDQPTDEPADEVVPEEEVVAEEEMVVIEEEMIEETDPSVTIESEPALEPLEPVTP